MLRINNISILDKKQCCGCNVCITVCPHNAISLQSDILGFKYPNINEDLCINCGICLRNCQICNTVEKQNPLKVYAVRHKEQIVLETSRSGGTFTALSDYILENNGIIYGASFTEEFYIIHKRATTAYERDYFKNSKYIQSKIPNDIFIEIKQYLLKGKKILFSGTPCQIAAVKLFLQNIDYSNLYLVDIVCQGVASPKIWKDYIKYIEDKYNDKVVVANFRDKSIGWDKHYESFKLLQGEKIYTNSFADLYYKNLILRECCHSCKYTSFNRISDITLGDFWGWEKVVPQFNMDNRGSSLVLINSQKGLDIFNAIKSNVNYIECNPLSIEQMNLSHPTPKNHNKPLFLYNYSHINFKDVLNKYSNTSYKYKLKILIGRIKKKLKSIIKIK